MQIKLTNNMELFLTILIVLACILVVLLVLVQNSKGGGLAAGFTSGNQVMSIFAVGFHKNAAALNDSDSQISEQVQEAASEMQQQAAAPAFDEGEAETE